MLEWIDVDSSAITAIAYDRDAEAIHVRFKNSGAEWRYLACSPAEWNEFSSPSTSKGKYVNDVLKQKPGSQVQ
jgi:hypothetical protein